MIPFTFKSKLPALSKFHAFNNKILAGITLLFTLLLSQVSFGQTASLPTCTKPNGSTYLPHCTSQDLQVVGAFLTADQCSCTAGSTFTATLNMKLFNKTGSTRTSFAFFAILQSTLNGQTTSEYITGCTGPVSPNETSVISFPSKYTFTCGASLKLTNVYLAWTDASDNRTCPLNFCDIAPKCGTPADITINSLLTASATAVASCDNSPTGSLTVTPSGGTAPYKIVIAKKTTTDCPSTPVTADVVATYTNVTTAQTKTGLAAGDYCVYVSDAATPVCTYIFTATVGSKTCCVNPAKPTICQVRPSACGTESKVILRVSGLTANSDYHVKQGGTEISGSPQSSSQAVNGVLTFKLTPGGGTLEVYGTQTVNGTTCTGTSATCADLTDCSTSAAITQKSETNFEVIPEAQTKVTAAPNPFNDRIKFTITPGASGRGSLDLYNTLGQKVKTVFQGQVEKGQTQTIEYSVPFSQRNMLLYQFNVGRERVSGKLLGLK